VSLRLFWDYKISCGTSKKSFEPLINISSLRSEFKIRVEFYIKIITLYKIVAQTIFLNLAKGIIYLNQWNASNKIK
jgi:hypothetical protein